MSGRINGFCKWFSNQRGFGFLVPETEGDNSEYFVHFSNILMDGYKTIKAGQRVEFEVSEVVDRGKQAFKVVLI